MPRLLSAAEPDIIDSMHSVKLAVALSYGASTGRGGASMVSW